MTHTISPQPDVSLQITVCPGILSQSPQDQVGEHDSVTGLVIGPRPPAETEETPRLSQAAAASFLDARVREWVKYTYLVEREKTVTIH